jgi:hypothetical protein
MLLTLAYYLAFAAFVLAAPRLEERFAVPAANPPPGFNMYATVLSF